MAAHGFHSSVLESSPPSTIIYIRPFYYNTIQMIFQDLQPCDPAYHIDRLAAALQILKLPAYDPSDAFSSPANAR